MGTKKQDRTGSRLRDPPAGGRHSPAPGFGSCGVVVAIAGDGPPTGVTAMSNTSQRVLFLGSLVAAALGGCVMVPVASDGTPIYPGNAAFEPGIEAGHWNVAVHARCSLQGRPAPLPRPTRISFCREQGAPVCVSAARAARRLATNSVTSRRRTAPRVPLVSRLPARRGPPRSPLIRTARPLGGRAAEGLGQWHMSCDAILV